MKIIIFGASGATGQRIVAQALDLGHDVTAFVRSPEKLALQHEKLNVLQGDVLDEVSVMRAIKGQEIVLCALGKPATNKNKLRTKGTENIIWAMEKLGLKRLICQSGLGAGDSFEMLPPLYRHLIIPLFLRHVFADHLSQEKAIKQSGLDWVIVRPANLTNKARTDDYQHGFAVLSKSISLKISREDVAAFMLLQLNNDYYLHQTPAISS